MEEERQQDGDAFESPSPTRRGQDPPGEAEADVGAFGAPDPNGGAQAASAEAFDALRGYGRGIVEAKQAIEERLVPSAATRSASYRRPAGAGRPTLDTSPRAVPPRRRTPEPTGR